MNNRDIFQDVTNAQQRSSLSQRRGKVLRLDEQHSENSVKPGVLARRKASLNVFGDKTSAVNNVVPEKKPSLLERRNKKLALDDIEMEIATSVLQLPEESLRIDLDLSDISENPVFLLAKLPPEIEKKLLQKRAADCLDAFNREVSEYVEYYKNFEVINPTNSFNMLPGDKYRYDPIHWAAINNDLLALRVFVTKDLNVVDQYGRNALYFATACWHVDAIKYLLENYDAVAQMEVLYDDLRHGYQMLIPEILNIDGVKDIRGVKDFLSSHQEYSRCLGV